MDVHFCSENNDYQGAPVYEVTFARVYPLACLFSCILLLFVFHSELGCVLPCASKDLLI